MATPLLELLEDEQAHPLALFAALSRRFGMGWVEWSASTLRTSLERILIGSGKELADINLFKSLATAAIANSDGFWHDWPTFHFLCNPLNNNTPNPAAHQELTVAQMMVAVDIAVSLRHLLKKVHQNPTFSEEVARFVAAQALSQGVWYLPGVLAFASPYAEGRSYKCRDCGNVAEVVFDDATCDVCTERWDATTLGSWKPNPDLVKKWGRNLRFFSKNPSDDVAARLEQVLRNNNIVLREGQRDRCVAHLLVALQYVGYRREQYRLQTSKGDLPEMAKTAWKPPNPREVATSIARQLKWTGKQLVSPKKLPENVRQGAKAMTNMGETVRDSKGQEVFKGSKQSLLDDIAEKKKEGHKYVADFHKGTRLRDRARRAGLLSNAAKYQGTNKWEMAKNKVHRALPGTAAIGVPSTLAGVRDNLRKDDPRTGRRRSLAERAGRTVGGTAADLTGWRVGMTAGMAAATAGEAAGGLAGRGVSGTGKAVKSRVQKIRTRKQKAE